MTFVLDTSAYSAFERNDDRLRKYFKSVNDIVVPLVVVGELRAGFAAGNKRAQNEQLLRRFLDSPNVQLAGITDRTTQVFADIYLELRRAGTPIGTNDLWIAAIAVELDLDILTMDKDFGHIRGLKRLKI